MDNLFHRRRIVKLTAYMILVVAAIALVVLLALWLFFPGERIRISVARELSNRTSQDVTIGGLSLVLYPAVGLIVRDVRIVDRQTSQEIVSVQQLLFDVGLLQLLKGRYTLDHVALSSPTIRLVRAADGTWNVNKIIAALWSETEASAKEVRDEAMLDRLVIGPLRIKDGTVDIDDHVLNLRLRVSEVMAKIDLRKNALHIDSAVAHFPPIYARLFGTISHFSETNPTLDINVAIRVKKEGRLAGSLPLELPMGAPIADIFVKAYGQVGRIALDSTFAFDPLLAGGSVTEGSIAGTLQARDDLIDVPSLDPSRAQAPFSPFDLWRNIWAGKGTAQFEGFARIPLEDIVVLSGDDLGSELEPDGAVTATFALTASTERVDAKLTLDLTSAGFVIPGVLRKRPGTPGSLLVDGCYMIPDGFVADSFEFLVGDGKLTGNALVMPGREPWLEVSIDTSDYPLENLDQVALVTFEQGTIALDTRVWQRSAAQDQVNHRGEVTVESAVLTVGTLGEPISDLNATATWDDQKAHIESASFSFARSTYNTQVDITDFSGPRVAGSVRADTVYLSDIVALASRKAQGAEKTLLPLAGNGSKFSMQMLLEADSIYAEELKTGPAIADWQVSGGSHRFDPFEIEVLEGTLNGILELNLSGEDTRWETYFDARDISLEKILARLQADTTKAKGFLFINGNLSGSASGEMEEVLRSIEGEVTLIVSKGEIKEDSLFRRILMLMQLPVIPALIPGVRELAALNTLIYAARTGGRSLDPTRIAFAKISGNFHLAHGLAHTEDLRMESSIADLLFRGDIDLTKRHMDMTITLIPLGAIGTIMGNVPVVGSGLQKAKEAVFSIDLVARGPISDPEVTLAARENQG